jgi:peptidoglycan LD-endopeptidase CwlK
VHPDLVRVVERAIQITPQDFRVQEALRTRERHAELVARGASRTMNSRSGPTATKPLSGQQGL